MLLAKSWKMLVRVCVCLCVVSAGTPSANFGGSPGGAGLRGTLQQSCPHAPSVLKILHFPPFAATRGALLTQNSNPGSHSLCLRQAPVVQWPWTEGGGGGLAGDGVLPVPRHPVRDERVPLGLAHDVAGQPPARRLMHEEVLRPLREVLRVEVGLYVSVRWSRLMLLKRNMSSVVNPDGRHWTRPPRAPGVGWGHSRTRIRGLIPFAKDRLRWCSGRGRRGGGGEACR